MLKKNQVRNPYNHKIMTPRKPQKGISLIESMVAIVVMAIGILGILGVQMRTLTDTQTSVRRAQAIRLIEDLSERMKVNPNSLGNLGMYTIAWGGTPPPASTNCKSSACNSAQLASYELQEWRKLATETLPSSDVNIFITADEADPTNRRQLGVMISWRENERTNDADYKDALATSSTGGAAVSCPANRSCHLQYIQLNSRCTPYSLGGPSSPQFFCPVSKTG